MSRPTDRSIDRRSPPIAAPAYQRWMRTLLLRRLERLRHGRLEIVDDDGRHLFGRETGRLDCRARVVVHDPRAWSRLALGGSIGAGESYFLGQWSCDDLTSLMRIFVANREALEGLEGGTARLRLLVERLAHALRRNSRDGSRRNIAAHYDLGNDFFEAFLDESMMYSCAVFDNASDSLAEASRNKLDLVCRKLDLRAGDRLLEIGTGWGGLALHAARHHGCHVTTTTISSEQYRLAGERIGAAGLADRVELLRLDYRELPQLGRRFDKLVSIEMIEAVGLRFLEDYFRVCDRLLEPTGRMLLQSIVIDDRLLDDYKRGSDFIQRYVFPGGALPSISLLGETVRSTSLRWSEWQDLTPHYAETLRRWRANLLAHRGRLLKAGYDETLLRLWEFYFCYCEGGFLEHSIGVGQLCLDGSLHRPTLASGRG